ncbi:hypothetical protein F0521_24310 [Ferrimonas sp. YFM]|nr:hypothetical protein F0521_24310 [Ferrimonas sp. YFM]
MLTFYVDDRGKVYFTYDDPADAESNSQPKENKAPAE